MTNDVAMRTAAGTEKTASDNGETMLNMLYALLLLGDGQTMQVAMTKDLQDDGESCNGVTQIVLNTRYIGVVHIERD